MSNKMKEVEENKTDEHIEALDTSINSDEISSKYLNSKENVAKS